MKKIKFRAWDKVEQRMFYTVEYIGLRDEVVHIRSVNIRNDEMRMDFNGDRYIDKYFNYQDILFDDIVLMQYIGIKDKNGVKIYEGDILYNEFQGNMFVKFCDSNTCYMLVDKQGMNKFLKHTKRLYEVIGNIYENPELLKGEK
jgi:uncharacterized phage protein (TIGR01671 family)